MRVELIWLAPALVRILATLFLGVVAATAASAQHPKPKTSEYNRVEPPRRYEQIKILLRWDSGKMRRWNTGVATIVGHRIEIDTGWWDKRRVNQAYGLSSGELAGLKALIEPPQGIKPLWTGRSMCGGYRLAIIPRGFDMATVSYLTYRMSDPNWGDTKSLERYLMALIARKVGRPTYGRGLGR